MNVSESLCYLRELNRALRLLIIDERTCALGNFELKYRNKRDQVKDAIVYRIGDVVGALLVGVPAKAPKNGNGRNGHDIVLTGPRLGKADMHNIRASIGAIVRDALAARDRERDKRLKAFRAKIERITRVNDRRENSRKSPRPRSRERIAAR
jgi:hypothetical protein